MRPSAATPLASMLALLASSCGPLPHPFEHDEGRTNSLLANGRLFIPVAVRPVDGAPGLADAMAKALEREDIATTTEGGGAANYLLLRGAITGQGASRNLAWRLTAPDGRAIGEINEPLPAETQKTLDSSGLTGYAATGIARLLRGDDSGTADLQRRPRVAMRPVAAPKTFDAVGLTRAMGRALAAQGLTITEDKPTFVIEGELRITPGTAGQDVVEVEWKVKSGTGKELGTVSQGSPVPHDLLQGPTNGLARQIAEAGAPGVGEVILKSGSQP